MRARTRRSLPPLRPEFDAELPEMCAHVWKESPGVPPLVGVTPLLRAIPWKTLPIDGFVPGFVSVFPVTVALNAPLCAMPAPACSEMPKLLYWRTVLLVIDTVASPP